MIETYENKNTQLQVQAIEYTGKNQEEILKFCSEYAKIDSGNLVVCGAEYQPNTVVYIGNFVVRKSKKEFIVSYSHRFGELYRKVAK